MLHNGKNSDIRLQLKCDGTRWRREGKWRGYWRMDCVASTLHTTSEHGISSITTADAHRSATSSRLNWRPLDLNGLVRFARKTKSGFCACAVTFKTQSTTFSSRAVYNVFLPRKIKLVQKLCGIMCGYCLKIWWPYKLRNRTSLCRWRSCVLARHSYCATQHQLNDFNQYLQITQFRFCTCESR